MKDVRLALQPIFEWSVIDFVKHVAIFLTELSFLYLNRFRIFQLLSGCLRKNRPLNFDQIFTFLQTSCARQSWSRINENTFRLLVIFRRREVLRQMLLTPVALKIALSSSGN